MNTASIEKFEAFVWDDKFNTGLESVDTQHHKLVDIINRLGSISTFQSSSNELGTILKELADYTVYHFETEEKLMAQFVIDSDHQKHHIQAHRHFTDQVMIAAKLLLGETEVSRQQLIPLLKYLTNWLVQHILGLDTRMAQEILALQAGCTHEEAGRNANAYMSQSANVLLRALNEMYGKLGDKTLEVMQKNQALEQEQAALNELNSQLEYRVKERTAEVEKVVQQLLANNLELYQLNEKLELAHNHLLQSEKLASIGQLAAGVAHEINNPIGFVNSNLATLTKYIASLLKVVEAYEAEEHKTESKIFAAVEQAKTHTDYRYIIGDIPGLLAESQDGLARVARIVRDLKDFSHIDESQWQIANIESGMDSTLNVLSKDINNKATVVKEYSLVPDIECIPSQINLVCMNLLLNAVQAINNQGTICLRTGILADKVWFEIDDNGKGIPVDNIGRIFDPFFTTQPIGKGPGLGLSLAYGIIKNHHGRIEVESTIGKGSRFRVWLPMRQVKNTDNTE